MLSSIRYPVLIGVVLIGAALIADEKKPFPKGSEKAVAAVRKAFVDAKIDEAAEPKGFGGSGGKGEPMFWIVRFHNKMKRELSVLPDGTIIRFPIPIAAKDLPKAVVDGVAKAAPGAKILDAEKNEMRATLKYVALDKAQVLQYVVDVVKDGKRSRISMNGSAGNVSVTERKEEKKDAKPAEGEKEIPIPEKAARAVKAIKGLYPDAVVKEITTEVFDDGTGEIEILTYEIEFISKGTKREMVASPEGVIPHLWAPVEVKALPKPVTDTIDKAVPGAKVESARAHEIRGSLRFGAIDKPKLYYTVRVDRDGKTETIKLKPDGSVVKPVGFPKK